MPIVAKKSKSSDKIDDRPPFVKLFETFDLAFTLNGTQAVADECPFCGKENHFYLNVEKGLYDCKVCGEQGNAYTFIRHKYKHALDATTDAQYRTLKQLRGIPLQTLKRHGLALYGNEWLIPSKSPTGEVVNLLRYRTPVGNFNGYKLNLPALPAALYGLDQLSEDVTRKLLICEGIWDAIAADQHLRDKKVRTRYDVLSVPGAGIFKEAWAEKFCAKRSVRLVYDNDEAGRKGQEHAAKILKPFASDVSVLQWPKELKLTEGYDVSNLIHDGYSLAEFTHEHCIKLGTGANRITFTRGDQVVRGKITWLWDGRIQFGTFASFSGGIGTQKSGIVRDISARATSGLPMPNCTKALPAFPVLYLTSEDGESQVCDLVEIAGGDLTRFHVHDIASGEEPIDILDCLGDIEALINRFGARLVVLDALNSFVGGDISSDSKARKTLSGRLQSLARRTGACIIGIRNYNRSSEGSSSDRSLGAISLSQVARCTMNTKELPPVEKGAPRRFQLEFERITNAPPAAPIPYEVEDLSTCDDDRHLRRIIWGKSMTREAIHEALGKR